MESRNRAWLVLVLFFFSGATALIYEVVWSKFLSQMFGSTIYAQTAVLAVFMGGLALGNKLFGRRADRSLRPVRAYGLLEIAIGIYAFLFPWLDRVTDHLFIAMGSRIVEHAGWLLLLKGFLAAALLLGPTILMGGTLPLMAAWLQRLTDDAGRGSARFYSVNSLGAAIGAALAGFFLVQRFGMIATLYITAAVNVIIGIVAMVVGAAVAASGEAGKSKERESGVEKASNLNPDTASAIPYAGVIVAFTGAVSMGLELLASRSLALIFGSSLQSFAVVLVSFILGIGLGSAWIASPNRRFRSNEGMIVITLCLAAGWVSFLVLNIESWVDVYRIARTGLARTPTGYVYHELLTVGIAMVVLGVPAASIGAVLPLMIRSVAGEGKLLGKRVGTLLTWNTLGCVAGTLFTGFFLMPALGLRNAFGALALTLTVLAIVIAMRRQMKLGMVLAAGTLVLTGALFLRSDHDWKQVMSSGIFRVRETAYEPRLMPFRKEHIKLLYYEDGPDATVSVEQTDGTLAPASIGLRINGKPDAGTALDLGTQLLVGHLPMMAKPGSKDVFVLGLASGMTAAALLEYPLETLDIAENCEPVIKASAYFDDWNRHALKDPRTKLWREDARTVLKLRPQKLYDVIITEPSNPWTVGVGSIFSREFYQLSASRLKPGGVVAQWFHIYETSDEIVDLVLRTFRSVFPNMEIWDVGAGDIILLGSPTPWRTGPDVFRSSFAIPGVQKDMAMVDIYSPEMLMTRQLASQRTAFAVGGVGPIQVDRFPLIEYAAPRAFYLSPASRLLDRYDERTHQQLLSPPEKRQGYQTLNPEAVRLVFATFTSVNGQLYGCIQGDPNTQGIPCALPTFQPSAPPPTDGTVINLCYAAIAAGDWQRADQLATYALQQQPDNIDAAYLKRIIDRQSKLAFQ